MITWLMFLICSAGDCHTITPIDRPFMGTSACFHEGMIITPSWEDAHPGWKVSKVLCRTGERSQEH